MNLSFVGIAGSSKIRLFCLKTIIAILMIAVIVIPISAYAVENTSEEMTLDSFSHSTIGLVTGATQSEMAAEMYPEAKIKYFSGLADVLAALDAEQIDCTIVPYFSSIQYLADYPNFEVLGDELYPCEMGLAFPKNEESDTLRKQVNEYIATIRSNGIYDELENNWLSEPDAGPMVVKEDLGPGEHNKLTIATSGTFVPFSYILNGEPAGFDVDFVTGFCNAYGYDFEIKVMDFNSILLAVSTGQCDMAASHLSITEERKESVNFSDCYAMNYNLLMYKADKTSGKTLASSFYKTFVKESRWKMIVNGLGVTVLITVLSGLFGTLLAALICLFRKKCGSVGNIISDIFVRIFQGTPILVILLIFYYVIFAHAGLSDVFVAVVVFTLNSAAFFSETIMSGINAVPASQMEAALALGFDEKQAFRLFVLPQAEIHFLPVYRGELISLLKGTSIVGYIAIHDLTKAGDLIRSSTFEALFPLLVIAVIYFFLSWLIYTMLKQAEKRVKPRPEGHFLKNVMQRGEGGKK